MNTDADVVVLGAGPVGLTTALLLAQQQTRVVLVDTLTAPSDLPRAISLADESFRIVDGLDLGLLEPMRAESHLDTGARYYGLKGRLLAETRPVASRNGHPAKSQFDQPVLEQLLWDAAVAHPMVEMVTGHRATDITQDADLVTVTVQPEAADGSLGAERRITGTWLAACDGGRSFTREHLGIELKGSTQEERWIVIDLDNVRGEPEPFAEFHGNGERPLVFVPGIKGRLRLEFMMLPEDDAEQIVSPARVRELCLPYHPGFVDADVRRAVVYVAHQRIAETYRVGRVLLVGDAAHLMPPFSGQGLNAGLRDAANVAWKLRAVLDGTGTDALLDTYQSERRAHVKKMVRVSHFTGAVVMARGVAATVRDLFFSVARFVPPAHRYLTSMRWITPPCHTDGVVVPVGDGVPPRLAAMVGPTLSNPLVEDASGARALLDQHLGSGWSLVAVGGDADALTSDFWGATPRVRLRPATERVSGPDELVDLSGLLAPATDALSRPHVLVVRPDRYVAAVVTPDNEQQVVGALRTYVNLAQHQESR